MNKMEELLEILTDVDARMERSRLDYMLVGSILSGVYGEPRFTRDIDLVVALTRFMEKWSSFLGVKAELLELKP